MSRCRHLPALHVIGKSQKNIWLGNDLNVAWDVFCKALTDLKAYSNLKIYAFVLMRNHYHLLCQLPVDRRDQLLRSFHSKIPIEFGLPESPNIFFLNDRRAYENTYKYIYRNPIDAHLTAKAENYPYSTIHMILGQSQRPTFCEDNMNLIFHPQRVLKWINSNWDEELYYSYVQQKNDLG